MKCLLDKEREVRFPCSKNCHLFGDCVCEFEKENTKAKEEMKFSELKKCPLCGSEEFYTNDYYRGTSEFYQRFDGEEANDNSQMYDGLIHLQGKRAYCGNCSAYLGNTKTDKLGKRAERALLKEGEQK